MYNIVIQKKHDESVLWHIWFWFVFTIHIQKKSKWKYIIKTYYYLLFAQFNGNTIFTIFLSCFKHFFRCIEFCWYKLNFHRHRTSISTTMMIKNVDKEKFPFTFVFPSYPVSSTPFCACSSYILISNCISSLYC